MKDRITGKYEVDEDTGQMLEALLDTNEPAIAIEAERLVRELRDGEFREVIKPAFVKISTAFKSRMREVSADAIKVWLFIALSINRSSGRANPSLRTMASALKMGINTIQAAITELENQGLLTVRRQDRRFNIYEATDYVSANRISPVSKADTDAESVSGIYESVSENPESVSGRRIRNQMNHSNQKNIGAERPHLSDQKAPDKYPPEVLDYATAFEQLIGHQPTSKSDWIFWVNGRPKTGGKGFRHFRDAGISVDAMERAFHQLEARGDITISSPNSLFNTAMQIQRKMGSRSSAPIDRMAGALSYQETLEDKVK